jgi:hypothetical protein
MKTLVFQLIKELAQLIILVWIIGLVTKLFFKHTLLGKITAVIFKDIYMFLRVSLRLTKHGGNLCYQVSKKVYKYLDNKYKQYEDVKEEKQVVNGNSNVIDLNTYKKTKKGV